MSEQKHTAGPWAYREGSFDGAFEIFPAGDEPPAYGEWAELAVIRGFDGDNEAEMEANARLIAAAPELLAALKAMEASLCDGFDTQAARMAGRKALIAARAALAKVSAR